MATLPVYALRHAYRGRSGVAAEPLVPWSKRKIGWLLKIQEKGGALTVNRSWCFSLTSGDVASRDLRRLIKEGLAIADVHARAGRRTTYRQLRLTEKGLGMLPVVPVVRVAEPYAKRKAAMAELMGRTSPASNPEGNQGTLWD